MNQAYSMLYYRVDDPPRVKSKPRWKEDNPNNIFNTEEVDEEDKYGFETQLITTTKKKDAPTSTTRSGGVTI